ncbi:MAG: asparaginase domain-containing protein [Roseicyclus sp.]
MRIDRLQRRTRASGEARTSATDAPVVGPPDVALVALDEQAVATAAPSLGLEGDVEAQLRTLTTPPSTLSPLDRLLEVAASLNAASLSQAVGAVVVTPEGAVEETAFALDLLVAGDMPVVVVTSHRAPMHEPRFRAAVAVAIAPAARAMGTLVVNDGEIHAARFVERALRGRVPRFVSPATGPIGAVVDGEARFYVRVPRKPVLTAAKPAPVALVELAMGDDGVLLDALVERGFAAAVIQATAPPLGATATERLCALALRLPVVLVDAAVPADLFEAIDLPASRTDVLARGVMPAGGLSAVKARLVVAFTARAENPHEAVAMALSSYV